MKSMLKKFCQDQPKQWHRLINPVLFAYREVPQGVDRIQSIPVAMRRSFRGPGTTLKELWIKEVNNPDVKSSYEYITELHECMEDSPRKNYKVHKRYKKHIDKKAKPRRFEIVDQVLTLLPTDK